ncbi:hypothetical protein HOG47_08530 [archaeon]|jgi:hypothetical protein|nr:hypothetical protein [archaeon]
MGNLLQSIFVLGGMYLGITTLLQPGGQNSYTSNYSDHSINNIEEQVKYEPRIDRYTHEEEMEVIRKYYGLKHKTMYADNDEYETNTHKKIPNIEYINDSNLVNNVMLSNYNQEEVEEYMNIQPGDNDHIETYAGGYGSFGY